MEVYLICLPTFGAWAVSRSALSEWPSVVKVARARWNALDRRGWNDLDRTVKWRERRRRIYGAVAGFIKRAVGLEGYSILTSQNWKFETVGYTLKEI